MAYIQPNSVIQLFQGINLDNRYMHTIYFANEAAQNSWFSGKVYRTYQAQSYTRYARNQIKLKVPADEVIGCTYLRFMNDRTVDKWFYAFILNTEYVNENTTLVSYEIDVMQTWFIQNGTIRPCMVRREHVTDDIIGNHLEEEPIGTDVYEADALGYTSQDGQLFDDYKLIINTSEDPTSPSDILNNGLVNGTKFYALDTDNPNAIYNQITALITLINGSWSSGNKPTEVIDMFTFPSKFSSQNLLDNKHDIGITHPTTLNGYTPKNKKLYTYPFSFLFATTFNGSSGTYRWEYFTNIDNPITFKCYGNPIGGGQIHCYPQSYDGVMDNIDASIVMNDFPKNPFAYDAYQAWVAAGGKIKLEREEEFMKIKGAMAIATASSNAFMQGITGINQIGHNALNLGRTDTSIMDDLSGMSRGANRVITGATGLVSTAVSVAEAQNKIAYAWKDARYQPNIVVGTATPNLVIANHNLDFHFFSMHVKRAELPKIDDFFSCFGYAINRVKIPNLTGRAYWNFVQTENCVISGDMPASSKEAIARIFDGGITFWHNGDNVGNYAISISDDSINNPII